MKHDVSERSTRMSPSPPKRSVGSYAELSQMDLTDLPLYGRSDQVQQLDEIYDKLCDTEDSQAVIVCGSSGTGKSTLIHRFCQGLSNNKGKKKPLLVSGKYDQFSVGKPYSALAVALNDLCDQVVLVSSSPEVTESIRKAVGSEAHFLMDVIPQLSQVIGELADDDTNEAVGAGSTEAFNRLAYVFRSFIRAVCDHVFPVIVFIDDLQWADKPSLTLIKAMITDSQSQNLLFIGAYRHDELQENHSLSTTLKEIQEETTINEVKVDNFDVDIVNEMLADLTMLDLDTTTPLSELVYRRTNGNVFFMLQLLDLLLEEKLLKYALDALKWTWDMDGIKDKTNISANVVELVAGKLQRLDKDVLYVLKIAACLWSTFDVNFLHPVLLELDDGMARFTTKEDVVRALDLAAGEGLLEKGSEWRYRFSHDRIQQGAYFLIPRGRERDLMHLQIGEIVLKLAEDYEGSKEWVIFIAVQQLNRGAACVTDPAKRVEHAALNLDAANMAISLSAFVPAAGYLKAGIDALSTQEFPWDEHYRLCLELHVASAQMEFCNGNVESGRDVIGKVLSNAKDLRDKLPAYFFFIDSLVHKERRYENAMKIGLEVLSHLGEKFPKRASTFRVIIDLVKTKRMLRNLSDDDFAKLPIMENVDKIYAMKLLHLLVMCAFWSAKPAFFALFILRMMQLTLHYGVTNFSSYAFMNYGVLLCSFGDYEQALRLGNVALGIVERLNAKECKGRVLVLMYSFINPWQNPLYDSLDPLLQAHRNGMECGDIETGATSCGLYAKAYLFCGLPLKPLEKDCRAYYKLMREYKQTTTMEGFLPTMQFILNLLGEWELSPTILTGEAMNQEEYLLDVVGNKAALQVFWLQRLQLAYYFGDMDLAMEMAEKFGQNGKNLKCHFVFYVFTFFEGLVYLEMARRTKKRMYMVDASRIIKTMKKWVKARVVDSLHKLQILEAEYKALTAKPDEVRDAYDLAIKTARRAGFLQDSALANERAGVFFMDQGDEYWTSTYLSEAHQLYGEWGALGKAKQLAEQNSSVFSPLNSGFSSNIRGRSRFTDRFSTMHKRLSVEEIESLNIQDFPSQEFRSSSVFGESERSSEITVISRTSLGKRSPRVRNGK